MGRRGDLPTPQQVLDYPDVDALLEQVGGEAVPQGVHGCRLVEPVRLGRLATGALTERARSITSVIGGNDLLDATSVSVTARLYGETCDFMRGTSVGGRDTLKGGAFSDSLFGDAGGTLEDASRGGNSTTGSAQLGKEGEPPISNRVS